MAGLYWRTEASLEKKCCWLSGDRKPVISRTETYAPTTRPRRYGENRSTLIMKRTNFITQTYLIWYN